MYIDPAVEPDKSAPLLRDDKNRLNVCYLTDRELLEEQVMTLRNVSDTVASFMDSLSSNPMFAMMAKGMMGKRGK